VQGQALLKEGASRVLVAAAQGGVAEAPLRVGDSLPITQLPADREALFGKRPRRGKVALHLGEDGGAVERRRARGGGGAFGHRQHAREPLPPFTHVATEFPEAGQGAGEAEGRLDLILAERPG
jgi:hypothetical protein